MIISRCDKILLTIKRAKDKRLVKQITRDRRAQVADYITTEKDKKGLRRE